MTSNFILDDNVCFNVCSCRKGNIDCRRRGLNEVPDFDVTEDVVSTLLTGDRVLMIRLGNNNIRSIPNEAFVNLTTIGARYFYFYLDNNVISNVDSRAFAGFESKILQIFLQDNKLTEVPSAIASLEVTKLDLSGNNLTSFTALENKIIYNLNVGLGAITQWPSSLTLTTVADTLQIKGYSSRNLDGFVISGQLASLIIAETKIVDVSFLNCDASVNVSLLTDVYFRNNEALDVSTLFKCNGTLNLEQISIRGSHLAVLPPQLRQQSQLEKIDVSNNSIVNIDDEDLKGLVNLKELYLSHNPIKTISLHAFDTNVNLAIVQFLDTALATFPLAVTSLPSRPLSLTFTFPMYVQCHCDDLAAMALINGTRFLNRIYCISNSAVDVPTAFDTVLINCP